MKNAILIAAAFILSGCASAYSHRYNSQQSTRLVIGHVVSVDSAIYDTVQTHVPCGRVYSSPQRQHRNLNSGTVLGGIVGGLAGSQIGGGSGRDAAIAAGAITGAMIGNEAHRRNNQQQHYSQGTCVSTETRIVGWNYTVEAEGQLLHRSTYGHRPHIGEQVQLRARTTFYD